MGFYQCIAYQWLACFTSSCFQARIIVGWTQYSEAGSAKVLSPAKAAITTCALNPTLRCLRIAPIFHAPLNRSASAWPTVGKNMTAAHSPLAICRDIPSKPKARDILRAIACFHRIKMASPLYQAIPPALSTLFASIDGHVKAGAPVFVGAAGSIARRKNQNGVEYYVRRFYGAAGTQQETYLGTCVE